MKGKTGKRVLSLLLMCVMVFTPVASQAATTKSFGVQYVYKNGGESGPRSGIRSVMIDDMNYYDLYNGASGDDRATSTSDMSIFLEDALLSKYGSDNKDKSLLEYWADVAYAIFAANGTYSAPKMGISNFAPGTSVTAGTKGDIAALLSREKSDSYTNGNDKTTVSGLTEATSLNDVATKTIQTIADSIGVSYGWIDDHNDSNSALQVLKDDDTEQTVLYSLVTFVDRSGNNNKGSVNAYNAFGIAFYNFGLQVIANDQLSYITAAEDYNSLEDAAAHNAPGVVYETNNNTSDVLSYYQNNSTTAADVGMEFTQSNSMEVSNSMEAAETYSFSEMIGSETKFSSSLLGVENIEETLKMEFTTGQTISTAYTDTSSVKQETSSTVSASLPLPAQTAIAISSSTDETKVSLEYDCPVAITYNVAVFAMSGQIYHDSVMTDNYPKLYEFSHFTALIGNNTEDAVTNLYNRAMLGANRQGYDRSHGTTYMWYKPAGNKSANYETKDYLYWPDIMGGVIDELVVDTVPIVVEDYLVEDNGNGAEVVDLIDSWDYLDCYVDYETEVAVIPTFTDNTGTIQYSLYMDPVYEDGIDLNEGLTEGSNSGFYSKYVIPNHEDVDENGNYIVKFYYTAEPIELSAKYFGEEQKEESEEQENADETAPAENFEDEVSTEAGEPVLVEEPEEIEEPIPVEESEEIEEPAAAEEPEEIEEPAAAEEPEEIEEPAAAEEPEEIEEPAAVEEPAEIGETEAAAVQAETEEIPAVAEKSAQIDEFAASDGTDEAEESSGIEAYVEPEAQAEGSEPEETYEPNVSDVIVEEGDLIGSVSNGGTVAGIDSSGNAEPSITIESIEVVEKDEIPEELRDGEDESADAQIVSYSEASTDASVQTFSYSADDSQEWVSWLLQHTVMSITGGTMSINAQSMNSEIYDIEPIYPLKYTKVTSDQKIFDMITGTTLNVDNIVVEGFNANDIEYYGFSQNNGYWILVNEDGNELEESTVASLSTNKNTGVTLLSADGEGTVYLKYMIDDDSNYSDMDGSKPVTNDDLSSVAMVQINVANGPFNGTVTATGTLTGYANETDDDYERIYINLDACDTISAVVYDETGKKVSNPAITWEAQENEEDGIILEDDQLYFTKPGTYHIRAIYGYSTINNNPYSDWIEVTALDEKALYELTIEDVTDPTTLSDIILGDGNETINLGWLDVSAVDQYELDWTKLENLKWYVDGEEVEPDVNGSYLYTATEAGDHVIYAECAYDGKYDVKSNELTLTVEAERELNSLEISDTTSPKTLAEVNYGEGKENVDLSKLKITALDQYGDAWADLGSLKWYVDDQVLSGTVYTVKDTSAGTHSIYAQCDGVKSNELSVSVKVPATSIKLNKESLEIKDGKTKQLTATMAPSGTTDTVTWTSSNKKVATVSSDGTVTAVSAGTATITAKTTSGKTATCQVHTVYKKNETFSKGSYSYIVKDASTDGTGKVYMTGFAKGKSKKKLTVPDTVTINGTTYKVTAIADGAFKGNSTIKTFTTGKNLTTIGTSAFEDCQSLKTVTIGNSVKKINFKAFYDCYKLKTLSIGKNVNYMGAHCFCNDSKLKTITIKTTKLKKKNVESPHVFINVNKATMKVPKSKYKDYKKLFTAREYGGTVTKK